MQLFQDIIGEVLLLENTASISNVNDAINNTYEVEINYHTDGKDNATGVRTIWPCAYGLTKAGNPVIRAFQPYGDTTTTIPNWKFFRIDRMDSWTPKTNITFPEPPNHYNAVGDFNKTGDKTMSVVYNIAKFVDNKNKVNTNDITSDGPVKTTEPETFKTDTEKRMDRLRQQLKDPKYLEIIKAPSTVSGPITTSNDKADVEVINKTKQSDGPVKTTETETFKTDTEKRMDRLRQQLKDPKYLDVNNSVKNNITIDSNRNKDNMLTTEPEVFKTDTEKRMDRLRQQLKDPKYVGDIMKNNNFK